MAKYSSHAPCRRIPNRPQGIKRTKLRSTAKPQKNFYYRLAERHTTPFPKLCRSRCPRLDDLCPECNLGNRCEEAGKVNFAEKVWNHPVTQYGVSNYLEKNAPAIHVAYEANNARKAWRDGDAIEFIDSVNSGLKSLDKVLSQ